MRFIFILIFMLCVFPVNLSAQVSSNSKTYVTLYGRVYNTTDMVKSVYNYSISTSNPIVWGEEWWSKGYHEFSISPDSSLIIYSDGNTKTPLRRQGLMKYFINYLEGEKYLISTGLYEFEHLKEVYIIEFLDNDHLMIYGHSGSVFDKQTRITIVYSKNLDPMLDIKQWDDN